MKNQVEKLEEECQPCGRVSQFTHTDSEGGNSDSAAQKSGMCTPVGSLTFPRSIRDLLEDGIAEEHRWAHNSGWTTFRIRSEEDDRHAL